LGADGGHKKGGGVVTRDKLEAFRQALGIEEYEDPFLTTEEASEVLLALMKGQNDKGTTEEDMELAIDWARQIRVGNALLINVLSGTIHLKIDSNGEVVFVPAGPVVYDNDPTEGPS
jgi:hypothetical protein